MSRTNYELRTPLNGILGFADLLRDKVAGPLNAQQLEFVDDILASGSRLLGLVEDMLELSALAQANRRLAREPVDVGMELERRIGAWKERANARAITITLEVAVDSGSAQLDLDGFRRIVDALLDNAIKFNHDGGSISVHARQDGAWLSITVADSGIGIAPDALANIAGTLGQLDGGLARGFGGIGAGLAIAAALARLHGGSLECASEVGIGSVFTLRMPVMNKLND